MTSRAKICRAVARGAAVALITGSLGGGLAPRLVRAAEDSPPAAPALGVQVASTAARLEPGAVPRRPFPRPAAGPALRRGEAPAEGAGGWWFGSAGMALALAVCGGLSLAVRRGWRWAPASGGSVVRVVGRTSLSPRHSVYLLSVGDRVLLVGTGPQGPPSLLGELTDPEYLHQASSSGSVPVPAPEAEAENGDPNRRPPGPEPTVAVAPARPGPVVVNWRRPGGDR